MITSSAVIFKGMSYLLMLVVEDNLGSNHHQWVECNNHPCKDTVDTVYLCSQVNRVKDGPCHNSRNQANSRRMHTELLSKTCHKLRLLVSQANHPCSLTVDTAFNQDSNLPTHTANHLLSEATSTASKTETNERKTKKEKKVLR